MEKNSKLSQDAMWIAFANISALQVSYWYKLYEEDTYKNLPLGENELPKIENSYAEQLKSKLTNMQHKLEADPFGWTVKI